MILTLESLAMATISRPSQAFKYRPYSEVRMHTVYGRLHAAHKCGKRTAMNTVVVFVLLYTDRDPESLSIHLNLLTMTAMINITNIVMIPIVIIRFVAILLLVSTHHTR